MREKIILISILTVICFSVPVQAQPGGDGTKTTVCDNLLRTGQMDAALRCYLQALDADTANSLINLRICQILEAQGKVDKMEPYFSRLDKDATEAKDFLGMLSLNYGTLGIDCLGKSGCPFFFLGRADISFSPPEELEPSKAARLTNINQNLRSGRLWFQKNAPGLASTSIDYFPVVTGAPLPYDALVSGKAVNFDFNFVSKDGLKLEPADFDSIFCGIPDSMIELQVEIDDPEYDVVFRPMAGSTALFAEEGRFYGTRGGASILEFERKGRPAINKKYLVVTSAVLTVAMVLLQR